MCTALADKSKRIACDHLVITRDRTDKKIRKRNILICALVALVIYLLFSRNNSTGSTAAPVSTSANDSRITDLENKQDQAESDAEDRQEETEQKIRDAQDEADEAVQQAKVAADDSAQEVQDAAENAAQEAKDAADEAVQQAQDATDEAKQRAAVAEAEARKAKEKAAQLEEEMQNQ